MFIVHCRRGFVYLSSLCFIGYLISFDYSLVGYYQESRCDREVDRLFKILERVTELKDSEITKSKALADIHIPKLSAELQVAESIADTLLSKRLKAEEEITNQLEKKRQHRTVEWDTFVHDMTNKCIRIDNTFKEREEEVRALYQKAEDKLYQNDEPESPVDATTPVNNHGGPAS